MSNIKFLPMGLVLGGGIGIVIGAAVNDIPMGIVFGGGFGLIIGLAMVWVFNRRTAS